MTINSESVQILLKSDSFSDRLKGINKLRQIDEKEAFDLIQPLIKDKNARLRYAAVSMLDTIGQVDLEKSLEILRDRLYNDTEGDVKAAAADAIAALKLTEGFPDLEKVYRESSDWLIQFSIIAALGEFGDARGFDLLMEALESENSLIQTSAISSLGELGDKKAIALLIPFHDNPDWQIRHRLAQALAKLGGSEVIPTLEKLAQDDMEIVAQEAKNYLST